MRVGVYGGTFDPLHIAHLIIAEFSVEQLQLDLFLFVPCFIPPHKRNKDISSPQHRLKMLQLALPQKPYFQVCTFELERSQTSYTVDTLAYLKNQYTLSRENLFLIIGADNKKDFSTWKEPDRIVEMAQLAVAGRENISTENDPFSAISLEIPRLDISSSFIRKRVREHKSITFLTPPAVEEYIYKHRLYVS